MTQKLTKQWRVYAKVWRCFANRNVLFCLLAISGLQCRESKHELINPYPDNFAGVGIELTIDNDAPVVVRTLDGSSAREVGIQAGDRLVDIDGATTQGMGLGEAVVRMRGDAQSQISVTVSRAGQKMTFVMLRRAMVKEATDYRSEAP